MTKKFVITSILTLSVLLGHSAAQEAKQRDLSKYAEGGRFDLSWALASEELEKKQAEARKFLWEKWRKKALAHCVVIFHNLEGDPTTHNFYIEPDKAGRWSITREAESDCCWFYSREGKERERNSWPPVTYYMVKRFEIMSGRETYTPIPENETRQPETYYLQFSPDAPKKSEVLTVRPFTL